MIIRVLLRVAPRRARTRLRSPRPRAAASDRAPSLPSRTKLQLSLTLTLLLAFLMRPVSSLFLCSFARPVAETRCPLFPFLIKATNLLPVL